MVRFTLALLLFSCANSFIKAADVKPEIAALVQGANSKDLQIRLDSIAKLGETGDKSHLVVSAVCEGVIDGNGKVAAASLKALETLHPKLSKHIAAAALEETLANRTKALRAIGAMGADGAPAARMLAKVALSSIPKVTKPPEPDLYNKTKIVEESVNAIGRIGVVDEETAKLLATISLSTASPYARSLAVGSLTRWAKSADGGDKILFPVLKMILADKAVAAAGCYCVGDYGPRAKANFGATLEELRLSPSMEIRKAAEESLPKLEK